MVESFESVILPIVYCPMNGRNDVNNTRVLGQFRASYIYSVGPLAPIPEDTHGSIVM